jgi:hypothetical protein
MDRVAAARELIARQLNELKDLVSGAEATGKEAAFERLRRWKDRTVALLREGVHPREADRLAAKKKGSIVMGKPLRNLVDEARMYAGFLTALDQELEQHPEGVLQPVLPAMTNAPAVEAPGPAPGPVVFIVHGHDEVNLLRLKELLRDRWQLEPLVLLREAGRGRTLIEKFEEEAQRAAFAFVLVTPDDLIATPEGEYAQARPNVVFELGWFYGRLGRQRVCILFKEGAMIHSDLKGISRIQFQQSVTERIDEMERELVAAGILETRTGPLPVSNKLRIPVARKPRQNRG